MMGGSSGQDLDYISECPELSRGQTTLDYAIGISVFLAVVLFVFLFIPGLLQPFSGGQQDTTVTADRVAGQLTNTILGQPDDLHSLDSRCTVAFFSNTAANRCSLDGGTSVEEDVSVDENRHSVNVTLYGNLTKGGIKPELLCWDQATQSLVDASDTDCDTKFKRGDLPPGDNSRSVTATRVATLYGTDVTIRVEVW